MRADAAALRDAARNRLRSALVASEVALALVALVGAGLFARSFQQTLRIDPGFDPNHVLLSQFYLSTNGYNLAQRKEFCRRLGRAHARCAGRSRCGLLRRRAAGL